MSDDQSRRNTEGSQQQAGSVSDLEARLRRIEATLGRLDEAEFRRRKRSFRDKLQPKLGQFWQYRPRPISIPAHYSELAPPTPAPHVAIVTPTLNQGQFLAQTIKSILDQRYPNLTFVIQDGGSSDDTQRVVAPYLDKLIFRTAKDGGQTNAINLGFQGITTDIMCYLNSDDLLVPGSLAYVAQFFATHPDVDVVYGHRIVIDPDGLEVGRWIIPPHDNEMLKWVDYIPQETMFWRGRVWETLKQFDENFNFALDWDFILRAQARGFRFKRLPRFLGCFRVHKDQKSTYLSDVGEQEMARLRNLHLGAEALKQPIHRAIRWYVRKHILLHRLYKLNLVKY